VNIDFYVSRITVSNFRGIQNVVLDLGASAPIVLVGPNNAGKSTVLDAIGLCLQSAKFSKLAIDDRDFWTDGSGAVCDEFVIDVAFCARPGGSLPAVKGGVGDPVYVHGVRAIGNRIESSVTRRLLDADGDNIMLTLSVPVSKARKDEFKGSGLGGRRFARVADISKWLPTIFQLDSQNLYSSLYVWASGPLQRLMDGYRTHLLEDSWLVENKPKQKMPELLERLHAYLNDKVLQSPYWNETLSIELSAKLQEYLGRASGFTMRPQLETIEQWLQSELLFRVSPGIGLAAIDSRRLGAGWQSLIRLAALEVVTKLEDSRVLLLMEEPETFLHPHLRRRMRRVFDSLQANHSQCVITTHSAEFISFSLSQDIVRLQMTLEGVKQHRYQTSSGGQALKDEEKLQEYGTQEIVFANLVVLSEGKADRFAIRQGLHAMGLDCDAESISVIGASGIENLPDYARLCSTLGIPWIAIHDLDMLPEGTQKARTSGVHKELMSLKTIKDDVLTWDNTLEDVLGCLQGKVSPEWTLKAYGSKSWSQMTADPTVTKYVATMNAIHTFCTSLSR
jgi:predicted ATP-dependent endonuclease of OLD family